MTSRHTAEIHALRGTDRPDRDVGAELAHDPEDYTPSPPKWLSAPSKRIWLERVAEYQRRNQRVQGFEESIAQYAALDEQIRRERKRGISVPASVLQTYLKFASYFYDTPASAVEGSTKKAGGPENPFSGVGKR